MAPCRAAPEGDLLERPAEAFEHYRKRRVKTIVCQDKHMGSRGIVVVTRDDDTAQRRFGITDGGTGCVYTRTGRRFFDDPEREAAGTLSDGALLDVGERESRIRLSLRLS